MSQGDKPGSDGLQQSLPNQWLYNQLNRLEDQSREQHQRLRSDMNAHFDALRAELGRHEDFSHETRRKVDKLETQRETDQMQLQRRSAVYGSLASASVALIIQGMKQLFGAHQ